MAQTKMLAPKETVWAIPISAVADPSAGPDQGEMADAVNISCAITADGFTLGMADSETDETKSICDAGNAVNFTSGAYEANLKFFRESNLADTTGVYALAFGLFKNPAQFILVKRIGKLATAAYDPADTVSWFYVESDYTQDLDEGDNPKQFTVPFIPQGAFGVNVTLAA